MRTILCLSLVIGVCVANKFNIVNKCSHTVWPALLGGKGGKAILPEGGGFQLLPGQSKSVEVIENWSGRVWGRTRCDDKGHCETGDCGKYLVLPVNITIR